MPQTVSIVLITIALLFPFWAHLLWQKVISPRNFFGPKARSLINTTVNIWVLNISVLDFVLLMALIITLTAGSGEMSFGKVALAVWAVAKWVLGTILFGNIVSLTLAIKDDVDYPNQDQLIERTYYIAGGMALIYLAYQFARFMLTTL